MGQICLAENESHIYPNMCAKFGFPTVVSKKRGVQTDRQRETAALYSRKSNILYVNAYLAAGLIAADKK